MPKGILKSLSESEDRLISLIPIFSLRASLVAQMEKNPPAMQGTRVQSLGREDPLEKDMATDSSILPGRIPQIGESGGLQSMGSQSQTRLSV